MAKMTVLELAKELGIPVPKLKPTLDSLGVKVRSVSAFLEEGDVQRVRQALGKPERPVVKRVAREEAPAQPAAETAAPAPAPAVTPAATAPTPAPEAPAVTPAAAAPAEQQPAAEQPAAARPIIQRPQRAADRMQTSDSDFGITRPAPPKSERPTYAGAGQRPYTPRPGGPGQGSRPYTPRPGGPGQGSRPYTPRPGGPGGRPGGPGGPGGRPGGPRPFTPRPGGFGGGSGGGGGGGGTSFGPPAPASRRDRGGQRGPADRRYDKTRSTKPTAGIQRADEVVQRAGTTGRWLAPRRKGGRKTSGTAPTPPREVQKVEVTITGPMTVKDLAAAAQIDASRVLGQLLGLGIVADINRALEPEVAVKVGEALGRVMNLELSPEVEEAAATRPTFVPHGKPVPRPPVVTIMGHVDHGKTTLLDAIRHTKVTEQEVGGITQHIGAYQVEVNGKKVTFLDTPGHEAFTAMRARGASVTDIAILVVAADDGVMPQTIEAIHHAQAAKVPIIVAINKIDRPDAQPDRIIQQLMEHGLVAESFGGDTIMVPISAKQRTGLNDVLEMILLVAEVQDLKADPNVPAIGTIVEAEIDKQKGPVATVLVREGTLRVGDSVIAGTAHGNIRAMTDYTGKAIKSAGPSRPAVITGLDTVPLAGDILEEVSGERLGKAVAISRQALERADRMKTVTRVTLQDLYQQIQTGEVKDLNIVLKADVQGSIEAIAKSLGELGTDEVRTTLIHTGVGDVSESDVMLAAASSAIIIGFHVGVHPQARSLADEQGIDVRVYQIIYDIIDDVKKAMVGLLAPVFEEEIIGTAEVKATFRSSKLGTIAGCGVTKGKVLRGADIRVLRKGEKVFQGKIDSLKHLKEDVREVLEGFECGIVTSGYNDYQIGDLIEAYRTKEIRRESL